MQRRAQRRGRAITRLICWNLYHVFKVKLAPAVVMVVEGDVGNKYNQSFLTVKFWNGKMVGGVPANMCKIFSTLLNKRNISWISRVAVGTPTLSKFNEPQHFFKRRTKLGMQREDGGAVISCKYFVKCCLRLLV